MPDRFTLPEARYLGSILEYLRLTTSYVPTLYLSSPEICDSLLEGLTEAISVVERIGVDPDLIAKARKTQKNLSKIPPDTELPESIATLVTELLKDLQMDVDRQLARIEQDRSEGLGRPTIPDQPVETAEA